MAVLTVGSGYTYSTIQAAINAAADGDTIKCKAGQLFTESLSLPNKGTLTSGILITTDAAAGNLPASGYRTNPSYAAFMPRLQSAGGGAPAIQTAAGANHYTFRHFEILEVPQGFNTIIELGYGDQTQEFETQEPQYITIDQCYIHGGAVCGQKRAIGVNGKYLYITNNYISDIKSVGVDGQCIAGWNGHGPITVTNNYLEGGTEPFILGGSDPTVRTRMTVNASPAPTTTSANVTCFDSFVTGTHTLAELSIGQRIALKVGAGTEYSYITSISSSTGTGDITWSPATSAPPDVGTQNIRAGTICNGLTFSRNYVRNNPNWIEGALRIPTNLTATPGSGGSLGAGTYYYKVQSFNTGGYEGTTVNSAVSSQASTTVSASGKVTLAWNADANASSTYRVWRGTVSGTMVEYRTSATNSFVDDGTGVWTAASPSGATKFQIKNLFELKAVQNAQVDSNIFEYVWKGSDVGYAIWLKSVNQDGGAWFIHSKNIVFEKNIIRHCYGFLEVNGIESEIGPNPGPLTSLTVRNNLCYDSGLNPWSENNEGYAMSITGGAVNLTIDHNTVAHETLLNFGGLIQLDSSTPLLQNFVCTNNMLRGETFGISDPFGSGTAGLNSAAPGYTFSKNAVADVSSGSYPSNNFYPVESSWEGEFVSYVFEGTGANFRLKSNSTYHNAGTDGKDVGADIALIETATANVITGVALNVRQVPICRFGV